MHTRGGDVATTRYTSGVRYYLIIQQTEVNYSAYTRVTTPEDIDQIIYFKAFVRFFYLSAIVSRISFVANSKTSF